MVTASTLVIGLLWSFSFSGLGSESGRGVPQFLEQLNCDQTDLETETRTLSSGKRIRILDFRCRESEDTGCELSIRYLTETNFKSGRELQPEIEDISNTFREEAELAHVREMSVWADNDRLDLGVVFYLKRASDGRWRDVRAFPERSGCETSVLEPSSLADAALWGDTARVQELIEAGEDFDTRDNFGATPLLYALFRDHMEAARLLIDAGADPNVTERSALPFGGFTALLLVAGQGDLRMVDRLIEAGADVNGKTEEGFTALSAAAARGRPAIVRRLLSRGADLDATSNDGETALMMASLQGRGTAVRELLAAGADPRLADAEGRTALHYALRGRQLWREQGARRADCRLAITYALLSVGLNPDAQDREGKSALIMATESQDSEVFELLSAFQRSVGAQ
jgi:ankyrin repeat protein